MSRFPFAAAVIGLVTVMPGCAGETARYPSLAPRAAEKLGFAEPEVKPVAVKPEPVLDAAIAEKHQQLAAIASGFAEAAATSETATRAARGKPAGSDSWLDAQTSLAGLDDWRAQASSLATDIDRLSSDRAAALAPAYPALAELRDAAQAETVRESETIDRLQRVLPAG